MIQKTEASAILCFQKLNHERAISVFARRFRVPPKFTHRTRAAIQRVVILAGRILFVLCGCIEQVFRVAQHASRRGDDGRR
jgi:hypothetical protein